MTRLAAVAAALWTPAVELAVLGEPIPQGSKSAKVIWSGGKPRALLYEDNPRLDVWRQTVHQAAIAQGHRPVAPTLDGPIVGAFVFTMPKPTTAPKRRRTWPAVKPDASKLLRAVEDSLTTAGVWRDDARLVEVVRLAKVYPGEDVDALPAPGVLIRLSPHPLAVPTGVAS